MKSHASMNRIYRLVWNTTLGLWVAVAETAKGKSRGGAACSALPPATAPSKSAGFALHARCRAAFIMLLSMAVGNQQVHAANAADASLVVGAGTVNTAGNITTINQATQRLAIDWTSLSTRANEALVFNQPNASAIALNRITGSSPSELLGSLTANGQVFILNPNGVLFGAGSQVNVGGLVASTMNLSNADFEAGNFKFSGSGAGSVINQGTLTAAAGGYLALLAPEVRNEGVMVASLGTALLAAGNKVTLNLDNGSLLGYSIDQGAINALAENKQLIQADGGQVLLSARAMDSLTTATVNNTGIIEAKTLQNKAGRILLMGDMEAGTVNVAGTLNASAPDGGDGGFIETSAAHVNVADSARITTKAASGKTGQWLVDPFDFVVASAGGNITGAALSTQLDNNNVTLNTTSGNSGTNGDLSVNDAVSWSAANTLTLIGERDVNVNANLTYAGSGTAGVTVQAVRDINVATNTGITSTGTGALPVVFGGATVGTAAGGNINMASGSSIATKGGDVTFKANAIQLSGATVAAAGGNIAMTASGTNPTHSLEITNAGATESNVSTTGAGTINLSGALSGNGAGATGAASGVKITSSTVSGGAGDITITGDSAWAGGAVTPAARGVRLDSGAKVLGAGKITVTGRVGNLAPNTGALPGAGLEMAQGAEVTSSGGDIAITGTFNDHSARAGIGAIINGKVQSGPAGKINVTASAIVGDSTGIGFQLGAAGQLLAGTGGLTIVSTVSSATTATNLMSAQLSGTINSTGAVDINAAANAPSAPGVKGVYFDGGSINANGANITLTGSGVPAPAPASSYALQLEGLSVTSVGGVITLVGDRINIASTINAGATGRVVIAPTSTGRQITLAGASFAEVNGLNLSNSEINRITAGELQIGTSSNRGSIEIAGNITAAPGPLPTISLVQNILNGNITQTGGTFSVQNLKVTGRSVDLGLAGNSFDSISGQALAGNFNVRSDKAGPLAVGAISATGNVTLNATAGAITDDNGSANNITAATLNVSGAGGITLGTNVSGLQALATTDVAGDINITAANALNTSNVSVSTNAGAAQTVSLSSSTDITVNTAFGNAQDNFKLTATGGNLNVNAALTANKLTLSAAGTSAQTAAITASGLELLGSGNHTLNHAGNAVTTLAGNTGSVNYSQAGALTIGTVNTAGLNTTGKVLVRTTGAASDLTVANAVSAGSTASDALVLASGRNFINSSGSATPLSTGSGGRYLVYAADPAANSLGAMVSPGNAFNRTFAGNAPTDASMTTIAGNRFVYSVQPTLNISGDNQTKAYGGADPTLTYTVNSGLVAGDTSASALSGALSAPTGAATTAPTYAITQGTLASSLGYAVNYTGGTLSVTGIPPAPPAPVVAAPAAATTPTAAAIAQTAPTLVAAYNSTIETVSSLASTSPGGSGIAGTGVGTSGSGQGATAGSGNGGGGGNTAGSGASGTEGSSSGGGVSAALDPGGALLNASAAAREPDGGNNN